ncbi:MAG: 6-carboxytetrahydropterin synthase [Candidatus Marinimicrobia bacterium]|nr:6-carboxytetrahydropterin synthase [Candidatus Neomarinimicrobiota bacterium]MCF7904661.1 6-carboxytetrahydropterin synthase [Candidatus Neomarinimicrobiota bacterium]
MIILNKVFYFNAAHQYGNSSMSEAENLAAFGKDVRVHGHNYELTVSVTGEVNPETGFIADLGHLKDVVNTRVVDIVDHSLIEKDIPWFEGKQPSTENMVVWIWDSIEKHLETCTLHRIRLQETPTIYTDYYGPNAK